MLRLVFYKSVLRPHNFVSKSAFSLQRYYSIGEKANLNVAVVGCGQIGTAVAKGLLRNGFAVNVYDPSTKNKKELESVGATWYSDVDQLLPATASANPKNKLLLVTALPAPKHMRSLMEDDNKFLSKLPKSSYWIDHTTTNPHEAVRVHTKAKEMGINSIEAPLTGGYALLCAGRMTTFIGCKANDPAFTKLQPVVKCYSETILRMGDYGKASYVKIITNQLAASHLIAAGEAVHMAKKDGVDMKAFFDGVRASAGNSYVFETEVPLMYNGTFQPGFDIELHIKDLLIARDMEQKHLGQSKTYDDVYKLHALTEKLYIEAMNKYGPKAGSSTPAKVIEKSCGEEDTFYTEGFDDWTYTIEKVSNGSMANPGLGVVHGKKQK